MEIKQLHALRAIAETGSFSQAASQLRLTQSALSHQLRNLEVELGETLLVRARPKAYPTSAGLAVLESAQRVIDELSSLQQQFSPKRKGPVTGSLRVAATNLAIVYVFGDLCEAFIAKYPPIELIFRSTPTPDEAVRQVVAGSADIAFSPFPVSGENLVRVVLGSTEHAFIVGESHPLSRQSVVSVDELRQYPFVRFQPGSGTRQLTDDLFLTSGGYPPVLTESNDTEFIKRIIAIGMGVALVPVYALGADHARGRLHLLRGAGNSFRVEFGIVHRKNMRMHSIELFKALCLNLRGPRSPNISIESAGKTPFRLPGR